MSDFGHVFFPAIRNDNEMKICHMFNIKLVTSLPEKIQQVLSHGSRLGGKKLLGLLSILV